MGYKIIDAEARVWAVGLMRHASNFVNDAHELPDRGFETGSWPDFIAAIEMVPDELREPVMAALALTAATIGTLSPTGNFERTLDAMLIDPDA